MQVVIFSILSGAQFWMNGRASFLAFRFLMCVANPLNVSLFSSRPPAPPLRARAPH